MAQPTQPSAPSPDDMHWGISYLREDIQDLRQEIRAVHARVDGVSDTLTARIDAVSDSLTRRIDSRFALLLTAMIGFSDLLLERHSPGDPSFAAIMQIIEKTAFIENVLAASMSPGMAASLDWSRGVQSRALTH